MLFRLLTLSFLSLLTACASNQAIINNIQNLPPTAAGENEVKAKVWNKVWGKNVRALTRNVRYPLKHTSEREFTLIDFADNSQDKFAQRIQAIINVETEGDYQFLVSADDSAEVWLSTDDKAVNKRLIAFVNKPSGYKVWDKYRTQKSKPISLEAGKDYYIEILHKEHIGADYLTVAWNGPDFDTRILSNAHLQQYFPPSESTDENNQSLDSYQEAYHAGYQAGSMLAPYATSFPIIDSDADGLPDFYENLIGLDSNNPNDAAGDQDGDLLSALDEYSLLTNPKSNDSDSDGIPDGLEVLVGLNANNPSDAALDLDNDGVSNLAEYQAGSDLDDSSSFPSTQKLMLSWSQPTTRTDGSLIDLSDIKGYKLYISRDNGELEEFMIVQGADSLSIMIDSLDNGNYEFAISTLTDSEEGGLSETISVTI